MPYFLGFGNLYNLLIRLTKEVAINRYDSYPELFELTKTTTYPEPISDLAESFGMMIVKVEARDLRLEKLLEKLQKENSELERQIAEKHQSATELRTKRDELEDKLQQKREDILASNHRMQLEILERKELEQEIDQYIYDLRQTLDRLEQLKALLPICPQCGLLKEDDGYWEALAEYLGEQDDSKSSIPLCPDCHKKAE